MLCVVDWMSFFLVEKWTGEVKNREPEKCDDLTWCRLEDLPDNTIPYIREALEKIEKGIFLASMVMNNYYHK